VQETEYTGAGKHPIAQLNLAREMGIEIRRGDPRDNKPGTRIVIPEHPEQIAVVDVDLDRVRRSYLRHALEHVKQGEEIGAIDVRFLAAETRTDTEYVMEVIDGMHRTGR